MVTDFDKLRKKIMKLNEGPWHGRVPWAKAESWLSNFVGEVETKEEEVLHALHLLSNFIYVGQEEMNVLLETMYRDFFRYQLVESFRKSNADTTDLGLIDANISSELRSTRFIGLGSASESGDLLAYHFRTINSIPATLFRHQSQILLAPDVTGIRLLAEPCVNRYVFLDDFCGSGTQAVEYAMTDVSDIRQAARLMNVDLRIIYLIVAGKTNGLERIRKTALFDQVDCVCELDDTFKVFEDNSRYYPDSNFKVQKSVAHGIFEHYGSKLFPAHPLGFDGGQIIFGFHYNCPDNSLPTFTCGMYPERWTPVFRRLEKLK